MFYERFLVIHGQLGFDEIVYFQSVLKTRCLPARKEFTLKAQPRID
jgi:hypothetical protein